MTAVQVLDDVWLVGSGTHETAFTDPHDCHCYLIWDGESGFLIDAGSGLGEQTWLANIEQVCDPFRLDSVLITHYHADHAGGAATARELGLQVRGHPLTTQALLTGDEERTQVARARAAGIYPADYRLRPATLEPIRGGQHVRSGDVCLEAVDAPGHSDGHLVFLLHGTRGTVLFSGDCLFAGGRVSLQAIPDCRLDLYATTVIGLADRGVDVLLPGHGELVLERARNDLDRAAATFRRLVPPENVLPAD
ncbi:MBL fold metallo-hydrolase [Amycolatopsis palatopharyngis]|uniref:MBL fold metallo-hydrolase n=1 Tax=Amycolatopsis palatopharyngis TaxID=187982 RepID=UPI000E24EC40|nr:MBL fold metallo-hydrolase [Amycolatopsis palatopharyngis]